MASPQEASHGGLLLIAALVCANVVTITTMVASTYGLGLHIWHVEEQDPNLQSLVKLLCCVWITALFNGSALFATKVSLLLYYRRLFMVNQAWLKIAWWVNLVYVMLWALFITLFYILMLAPELLLERSDPKTAIKNGTCLSGNLGLIGQDDIPKYEKEMKDWSLDKVVDKLFEVAQPEERARLNLNPEQLIAIVYSRKLCGNGPTVSPSRLGPEDGYFLLRSA